MRLWLRRPADTRPLLSRPRYLQRPERDPLFVTTDRVLSVLAILGIGLPMLFLAFDYAVFAILSLVQVVASRLRHS